MSDDLIAKLADILRQQQGITKPISGDSRICGDLGVCEGDFQDYMEEVWRVFQLRDDEVVNLDVPEGSITLSDVARWVESAG
jgi:hypothetical protein